MEGASMTSGAVAGRLMASTNGSRLRLRVVGAPQAEARANILTFVKSGVPPEDALRMHGYRKAELEALFDLAGKAGLADEPGQKVNVDPMAEDAYEFLCLVDQAAGEAVSRHVVNVTSAGSKDWKASAWWLERMHDDRFGKKLAIHSTAKMEHTVKVETATVENMSPEQLEAEYRKQTMIDATQESV